MPHLPFFSNDLFSASGFQSQQHRSERNLKHAFEESHKRDTITRSDRPLLQCDAHVLYAMNTKARILWTKAVCRELQDFFGLDRDHPFPDEQLFFVTLTDISCCMMLLSWTSEASAKLCARASGVCGTSA
jgi:hypothetical protein